MNAWIYTCRGIVVCHRRRAQQTGHFESPAFVRAIGGRDRKRASAVAAVRLQAPARAARGWVRGITNRGAAASLSAETGAAHGARRVARSFPALLVEARRCPGTTLGQDGQGALCQRKEKTWGPVSTAHGSFPSGACGRSTSMPWSAT